MSGDLEEILPQGTASQTEAALVDYWRTRGNAEAPRRYLGMSAIGKECERQLWYSFRHCSAEDFDGRMYRLFNRGHREEAVFAEELRGIGCEVILEGEGGEQVELSALGGHFRGHMDAAILGIPEAPKTWHVGEFKTHSAKSFAKLKKEGVQLSKPEHYAQMQAYMHYSGMTRALYLAVNKDNDEVHAERIKYDAPFAAKLEAKAERIINSTQPPERIAERRDDYRCRFCPAKSLCHGSTPPEPAVPIVRRSCRQCCHATPEANGTWFCGLHKRTLGDMDQRDACDQHLLIPGLINFAEPIDAHKTPEGFDVIEFRNLEDGAIWHHGNDPNAGHYTSADLMTFPAPFVGVTPATMTKSFSPDGTVSIVKPDILDRYTGEGIETLFTGDSSQLPAEWMRLFGEEIPKSPLAMQDEADWQAVEFAGGRVIISTHDGSAAEIRIHAHPDNEWWHRLSTI